MPNLLEDKGTEKQTVNLLVIEDNPTDIFLVRKALEVYSRPIAVAVATDGDEGLEALRSPPEPDLVILDLNLPKADGFTILRQHKPLRFPVVIFSSSQDPADAKKAISLGASAFVAKPFGLDDFLSAVRNIFETYAPKGND